MAKVKESDVSVHSVSKDVKERVVVRVNVKAFLKYIGFEGYRLLITNVGDIDSLFDNCIEVTLTREYVENTANDDHAKE